MSIRTPSTLRNTLRSVSCLRVRMRAVRPFTRGEQEQDNDKQERKEAGKEECIIVLGSCGVLCAVS